MALDATVNFAKVTVSTGYTSSATSIVLNAGQGTRLPTAPFNATWWDATDYGDPADDPNVEIVRVTGISTDTLTIVRAQEGTIASAKNITGKIYKMVAGITSATMSAIAVGITGWSSLTGPNTFTGANTFTNGNAISIKNPASIAFNSTNTFRSDEFAIYARSGGTLATDALVLQTSNGTGGAYVTSVTVAQNGNWTFNTPLSVGSYLTQYSASSAIGATTPSIRADVNGNLVLNSHSGGSLYLNNDSGANAVYFCNGASTPVGSVGSTGILSMNGHGSFGGCTIGARGSAFSFANDGLNVFANPTTTGGVYLNFEGGTGGTFFCNGAGGVVGVVNSGGVAQFNGGVNTLNSVIGADGNYTYENPSNDAPLGSFASFYALALAAKTMLLSATQDVGVANSGPSGAGSCHWFTMTYGTTVGSRVLIGFFVGTNLPNGTVIGTPTGFSLSGGHFMIGAAIDRLDATSGNQISHFAANCGSGTLSVTASDNSGHTYTPTATCFGVMWNTSY